MARVQLTPFFSSQLHVFVAFMVSWIGIAYWYVWCVWLPKRKGYRLKREWTLQDDGVPRYVFRQVLVSDLTN